MCLKVKGFAFPCVYRRHQRFTIKTLFLLFKCVTSETKQFFVSRTNECASGWTLISSIGDVSVSIAILSIHRSTIWNLKTMPGNRGIMRTLTYKHKIWGNLWYLKPHLITFRLFNVLESKKRRTLMLNLGIVKFFFKKVSSGF